jgi:hypothetical protein
MKVWIGYECDYDYANTYQIAVKVFDDEAKALAWEEEIEKTDLKWRSYEEFEVE